MSEIFQDNVNKIRIGPTEPIVNPVVNRALDRLFCNDEYIAEFIGQAITTITDKPNHINNNFYLSEKLLGGQGLITTVKVDPDGIRYIEIASDFTNYVNLNWIGVNRYGDVFIDGNPALFSGGAGNFLEDTQLNILTYQTHETEIATNSSSPHQDAVSNLSDVTPYTPVESNILVYNNGSWEIQSKD
jgi:hypothetical protein